MHGHLGLFKARTINTHDMLHLFCYLVCNPLRIYIMGNLLGTIILCGLINKFLKHLIPAIDEDDDDNAPLPEGNSVCIYTPAPPGTESQELNHAPQFVPQMPCAPTSSASHANPESIEATTGSEGLGARRAFQPANDVLLVQTEDFDRFMAVTLSDETMVPPWAAELRHLAYTLPMVERNVGLPMVLQYLPKLETVSIVVPQPSSEKALDYEADIELSAEQKAQPMTLRRLTSREAKTLMLHAEYTREDPMGLQSMNYTISAKEHVAWCSLKCEMDLVNMWKRPQLACFDDAKKKLLLKFQPACFVHL